MRHCKHYIMLQFWRFSYCVTAVSKDNETRNLADFVLEITDKKKERAELQNQK